MLGGFFVAGHPGRHGPALAQVGLERVCAEVAVWKEDCQAELSCRPREMSHLRGRGLGNEGVSIPKQCSMLLPTVLDQL